MITVGSLGLWVAGAFRDADPNLFRHFFFLSFSRKTLNLVGPDSVGFGIHSFREVATCCICLAAPWCNFSFLIPATVVSLTSCLRLSGVTWSKTKAFPGLRTSPSAMHL